MVRRLFQDYCNWSRIPAFSEFVFQSAAAEIAAALMQSQTAKFSMNIRWSPPGAHGDPWHHDQPTIASPAGRTSASDPADPGRRRPLRCIRGSHRWEAEYSPTRFNGTKLYEHTRFSALPDIDAHEDEYDIVSWALEPGMRWPSISHRPWRPRPRGGSTGLLRPLGGDDAAFADRGGVTSPPFPELTLRDGDPLDSHCSQSGHRRKRLRRIC